MVNNLENGGTPDRANGTSSSSKVGELKSELENLKNLNGAVKGKMEASESRKGCLGFAIVCTSTIVGAVLGFGFLSIVTGIGGFVIGTMISGALFQESPEKVEYEARKRRIQELETILSQVG